MSVNHGTNCRQKRIDVLRTINHIDRWYIYTEQVDGAYEYRTEIGTGDKNSIDITTVKLREFAQALISHAEYLETNRQPESEEDA